MQEHQLRVGIFHLLLQHQRKMLNAFNGQLLLQCQKNVLLKYRETMHPNHLKENPLGIGERNPCIKLTPLQVQLFTERKAKLAHPNPNKSSLGLY